MLGFAAGTPIAGRYLLVERLAASPGAQIWSAFDDVLGRPVAVKFFPTAAGDEHSLIALRARARAAARVSHPHLVGVLDVGEAFTVDGAPTPFVVLSLVDGELLGDRLTAESLSATEAAQIGAHVGQALTALHRRGLTHGEVDAGNVMLTATGAVLLGVVGSAQLGWDTEAASEYDDVRALGQLVESSVREVPAALAAVCERATRVGQTAGDLATAYAALTTAAPTPAVRPRYAPSRRRVGLAAVGLAGAVVAAGVGGVTAGALPSLLPTGAEPSEWAGSTPGSSPRSSAYTIPSGGTESPRPIGSTSPVSPGVTSPGQSTSPSPSTSTSPTPDPAVVKTALGALRDSVTAGRSLGEITAEFAQKLDSQIGDMLIDARLGKKITGKLQAFRNRVNLGGRSGDVTADRATALLAAADDVEKAEKAG
ncbi:serine/threonine protein kinase [Hamadaea flava]|uniref:non-specific serine/threonine protein kinase n=1 Tax=Hamadaea flava TaxID=1742688 RepID=A0ABV8LVZ1_9ACTN|nr:protein kinase [Hamadaea flava]MCP2328182.1 serine/threonine protein kinase [Hamadaea flava]